MGYTGRVFRTADEAGSGLFNHLVPLEQVLDKAKSIAREIVENTSAVSMKVSSDMPDFYTWWKEPNVSGDHFGTR